mgnify:CR=1 FL=1
MKVLHRIHEAPDHEKLNNLSPEIKELKYSINNKEFDDFIILRSDGTPTYNFSAAVDDMDMNITTVIRGDDHITNTLKQINVLAALDTTIPSYAHLPMVLAESGKRLSKRDGAEDILDYKKKGYLNDALVNYLVRLGWSHGEEEIFSLEKLQITLRCIIFSSNVST